MLAQQAGVADDFLDRDESVRTINLQSNGQIIIGGGFTFYDNQRVDFLAGLDQDGGFDESLKSRANGEILWYLLYSDSQKGYIYH